MKKYLVVILIAIVIASCGNKVDSGVKENTTEVVNGITKSTFKVWGNCEICKETIESSLKVDGIVKADWNVDSKIMTVY